MNRRILYHPLWTHAAAVAILVWIVVRFLLLGPLPDRVPVHFGFEGEANRFGSPWEIWLFAVLIPLAMVLGSVVLDEVWARQEDRKRWNLFALIDEVFVGFLLTITIGYFDTLQRGDTRLEIPWTLGISLAVAAVVLAAVLEWLRPHRPFPGRIHRPEADQVQAELRQRISAGDHWAYWQIQNPLYVTCLALFVPVALVWATVVIVQTEGMPTMLRWTSAGATLLGALVTAACYGGLRVMVTANRVRVKLGVLGIPLLWLDCGNLEEAKAQDFSPLRDFGGWGIRLGRLGWGFFFRGTRGVHITTKKGRRFLVGSDNPEALATAIRAAIEACGQAGTGAVRRKQAGQ
jgi:hypothetical protein